MIRTYGILSRNKEAILASARHVVVAEKTAQRAPTTSPSSIITSNIITSNDRVKSNRTLFREIPPHPSIVSYIESLGIGIPPKKKRSTKIKSRSSASPERKRNRWKQGDVMSRSQEEEFLSHNRSRKRSSKAATKRAEKNLPPPPFGGSIRGNIEHTTGENEEKRTIHRLPVKVLGSVGSIEEEFPRGSKGLPEVAIAGRSNVGKSTLLNALLYGNLLAEANDDDDASKELYNTRRRRTTPGNKLPRGAKAITSPKPGETRSITFYQLSCDIINGDDTDTTATKKPQKTKMSCLLADLPGYGFAYANAQTSKDWNTLMRHYVLERGDALKRVLWLIDARHGIKNTDLEFLMGLDKYFKNTSDKKMSGSLPPIQIVLTKCDLVKQDDLARRVVEVRQEFLDCLGREPSSLPVMLVSAKSVFGHLMGRHTKRSGAGGAGVLELQRELAALVPEMK